MNNVVKNVVNAFRKMLESQKNHVVENCVTNIVKHIVFAFRVPKENELSMNFSTDFSTHFPTQFSTQLSTPPF